jgi:hypothetical protein
VPSSGAHRGASALGWPPAGQVRASLVLALATALALASCRPAGSPTAAPAAGAWTPPPRAKTAGCVARDGLPDPACTPGAVDARVGQANVAATICVRGYTRTVRPPVGVTNAIKRRAIAAYGNYAGSDLRNYELDHLISLELGGAPADEANLWPEAHSGPRGSEAKDAVENFLHQQVCAGKMTLADAQRAIATDWVRVYDAMPERSRREVGEGAGEGQ